MRFPCEADQQSKCSNSLNFPHRPIRTICLGTIGFKHVLIVASRRPCVGEVAPGVLLNVSIPSPSWRGRCMVVPMAKGGDSPCRGKSMPSLHLLWCAIAAVCWSSTLKPRFPASQLNTTTMTTTMKRTAKPGLPRQEQWVTLGCAAAAAAESPAVQRRDFQSVCYGPPPADVLQALPAAI